MISERLLNIFKEPHNTGILQSASGIGQFVNEETNEVIKLYIKIEKDYIIDASFKIYSGVVGIAIMSVFTDMLKNKSLEEALQLQEKDVLAQIGDIEPEKEYLVQNAIESLKLAEEDYKKKLEKEAEKAKKSKK